MTFRSKLFQKQDCMISARLTTPGEKQTGETNENTFLTFR